MKRILMMLLLCLCSIVTTALALTLPDSLTAIEDEAFSGDRSLKGVLHLPSGIKQVGTDAFSGTGLFAVHVPAGTESVGNQTFVKAAYVYINGSNTKVGQLINVQYIVAPAGSSAQSAAASMRLDFVATNTLLEHGGFYYQDTGNGLTLLSAKDATQVGASVQIPEEIGGKLVTAISPYAFTGCTKLTTISLPIATEETLSANATKDCAQAVISFYGEKPVDPIVYGITANVTAGSSGNSITWKVDAQVGNGATYLYTVERNGTSIVTEESAEATFTYEAQEAGAYQLLVTIIDRSGTSATGQSAILYIAVEAMVMTVPENIMAGENLTVTVDEVAGAQGYSVYVTNEATGELVHKHSMDKAGDVSIDGYLFTTGEYRVSGYVHGNDFRFTVPTVKNVSVTGTMAEGLVIPAMGPFIYSDGFIALKLSDTALFTIRYQLRHSDGTLTDFITCCSEWDTNNTAYISFPESYKQGGVILVQATVQTNGRWSAWGPVTEITLNAQPTLVAPVVTCPETVQAGADFTISFTEVEDATWYNLFIDNNTTGESWYANSYSSAQTVYVSGAMHNLPAGNYTVRVTVFTEGFEPVEGTAKMTITGKRFAAPQVSVVPEVIYLYDGRVTITVTAPGFESAYAGALVLPKAHLNAGVDGGYYSEPMHLNSSGVGSLTKNYGLFEGNDGQFMACYAFVFQDGCWSEPGVVFVPIRKPEPLSGPVISMSESLRTGEDVSFSFAAVEGAESYEVVLYSTASPGSGLKWFEDALPDTNYTYPGYMMAAGTYYIQVEACAAMHGTSTSKQYFTVTGTKPAAPAVTCNTDEAYVGGKATFTIDADGADEVYAEVQSYNSGSRKLSGSGTTRTYTYYESDVGETLTFRFTVKKDGVWSQWATVERTVLAVPPLDSPTIYGKSSYLAGEDLVFAIDPVKGATEYVCRIYFADTWYSSEVDANNRITFSAGKPLKYFAARDDYRLVVTAYGNDGATSTAEFPFVITGTRPAAPVVSVNNAIVAPQEQYTFAINTPGGELLGWCAYEGEPFGRTARSGLEIPVMEDITLWTHSMYHEKDFYYTFTLLKAGIWSEWSEPVLVRVTSSVLLPGLTVSGNIALGSDQSVSVAPVEGAEKYEVVLYNAYGLQVRSKTLNNAEGGEVVFEGYHFSPATYTVKARAFGGSSWSDWAETTFTVIDGTRPTAPIATADHSTSPTYTNYGFTIDTTGAEKAAVRYYRVGETNYVTYDTLDVTGDTLYWTDKKYSTGEAWNYAFAVQVDGVWSPWTTTQQVSIVAE